MRSLPDKAMSPQTGGAAGSAGCSDDRVDEAREPDGMPAPVPRAEARRLARMVRGAVGAVRRRRRRELDRVLRDLLEPPAASRPPSVERDRR